LDDALCLVVLFSFLPSDDHLINSRVQNCERLQKEFLSFVMHKGCLKKTFLSIKGIYYQAEVMGQSITWVAPYKFKQVVPTDVDMRVMLTFLEFYETLLHFTNYKLYNASGLTYPPQVASVFDNAGKVLAGPGLKLQAVAADDVEEQAEDPEDAMEETVPMKEKPLLGDCFFYLSREVPTESLVFVIKSFGGRVIFEGDESGLGVNCEILTHHVVDRPVQAHKFLEREYVQPQWVYDSCNNGTLLPTFEYLPGKELPDHLSPFVDDDTEGYIPKRKEYLQRVRGDALALTADGQEEEDEEADDDDEDDEEDDQGEENEADAEELEAGGEGAEDEMEEDISGDEQEEEVEQPKPKGKKTKSAKAEEDQKKLAHTLLSNKNRKMYQHIKRAESSKDDNVAELTRKRKDFEQKESAKKRNKK